MTDALGGDRLAQRATDLLARFPANAFAECTFAEDVECVLRELLAALCPTPVIGGGGSPVGSCLLCGRLGPFAVWYASTQYGACEDCRKGAAALRAAGEPPPRYFPIQNGPAIPWEVIAPHERQAKSNHGGQTLQRLAERGGLSPCEAVAVLEDRDWHRMDDADAKARLVELVRAAGDAGGTRSTLQDYVKKLEADIDLEHHQGGWQLSYALDPVVKKLKSLLAMQP